MLLISKIFYCLLILFSFHPQINVVKKNNHLYAIVRSDNNFVTYNDFESKKEPLNQLVEKKIRQTILSEKDVEKNLIFKVVYNKSISIYIIKTYKPAAILYYVIAFNSKTKKITGHPVFINGKWMENNENGFDKQARLLTAPLIMFKDINADGHNEIIIKERAHNGTLYNAYISNYFTINNEMDLKKMIAIESKYIVPTNDALITRLLIGNQLLCDVKFNNKEVKLIGKANILFGAKEAKVINKKIYLQEYADLLITGSGLEDGTFIKEGYNFWY